MIHIIGSSGIISTQLQHKFNLAGKIEVHSSGNWNFLSVSKGDDVFFLRSISSPFEVMNNLEISREFNVIKTKKAISEILMSGARVIFASSDVVYGETGETYASEETPINPYGEYANQKASIEQSFKDDLNFLSLRISSVIGEGSKLRQLLTCEGISEIFDPVIRTPIHKDDLGAVCSALLNCNFRENFPNGILNAGGNISMSNLEIAKLEATSIGVEEPIGVPRTEQDKACRPGKVRMATTKAQQLTKLGLDILKHYE